MKHDSSQIVSSVNQLISAVTDLLANVGDAVSKAATTAAGRAQAAGRALVGRDEGSSSRGGPGKSGALKKALKAHWAKMTPAQRQARIKKMLAGRGLKPIPADVKAKRAANPRSKALKRAIKAHWDSMTPEQRKARIKKMLAARGLKPKAE